MFMKNFKLKFEQNWPKPLLITNHGWEEEEEAQEEEVVVIVVAADKLTMESPCWRL